MAASEQPVRTVGAAVDAFLARPDLAVSSRRSYAQTLNRLASDLGVARALATLDAGALDVAMHDARGAPVRRRPGIVTSRRPGRSSRSAGAAAGWVPMGCLALYARRDQTHREHAGEIQRAYGYRDFSERTA